MSVIKPEIGFQCKYETSAQYNPEKPQVINCEVVEVTVDAEFDDVEILVHFYDTVRKVSNTIKLWSWGWPFTTEELHKKYLACDYVGTDGAVVDMETRNRVKAM